MTEVFDLNFPREYLRAALMVSLLSVWVLVFLFYYLNRYTKRTYFTIWTAAWLFYALWLTVGFSAKTPSPHSFLLVIRQWCVGISAIFLLWGSLEFLEIRARQILYGLFMVFILSWSYCSPSVLEDPWLIQLPIFSLIGMASMFAGLSFYRQRKRHQFVGVGLLCFGFFVWGIYLATYPFTLKHQMLFSVGFLVSAVLQLFIAVSMIVLVLEEARYLNEQITRQIASVNSEKEQLQLKILSTEEECRSLFARARLHEGLQKAYEDLRQTQHSVMQQERLRALGEMSSGIAHDINNALSPVLAFSELLLHRETGLSENARKNLQHIRMASEDIAQIVARLGLFSRRRENRERMNLVNINHIAEEVIELTSPRWRDMPQSHGLVIQVKTELAADLPELYSNESELREGLTNLVLNAVDALPKGGVISVVTRALNTESNGQPGLTHLVLEVRDNGIGMDEKTRRHCLEPFFTTKRDCGGTGLGLAMVYGMMERHQGTIDIESQVGRGTIMRLVFPLRASPSTNTSVILKAALPCPSLRILCIDDEPLLREVVKEMLELQHHKVQTADGGQKGLDLFHAAMDRGEAFDVVITDLGMPYVDGREVAEKVKNRSPSTPVILLTGWGVMLTGQNEFPATIDAVISKPPRLGELFETLGKVMRRRHSSERAVVGL